jgi:hypothetical protein
VLGRAGTPRSGTDVVATTWERAGQLLDSWTAECASIIGDMKVCCICGSAFLGRNSSYERYSIVSPSSVDADVPPYGFKNVDMLEYCSKTQAKRTPEDK